ncbi:NlpC/P60 family protein [Clostridium sp. DJ247]|uniref:C40 family peptidase n=1 Tax=Clostridium sp. DJ247 TaxID=2726188 RepID=UPI00162895D6|nr:C40 family peptidase [Clostridium sp. DJ247]MBC2581881.1 glycoside hydrolase [Clostridium sp. DJ247]
MNKINKIFSISLLSILVLNKPVLADPTPTNIQDLQVKIQNMESDIEKMDNQIQIVLNQIDENQKQIAAAEKEITDTEKSLKNTQDDLKSKEDLFNQRVRSSYITGTDGYFKVLIDSSNLDDFLSRIDFIRRVLVFDNDIIDSLENKENEISSKKKSLQDKRNKLLSLKTDNESKLSKLNADKDSEKKLIDSLIEQELLYQQQILQNSLGSDGQINTSLKQLEELRKSFASADLTKGAIPFSKDAVIAYASTFLGTTYVWGGTTPSPGFDCSGFLQYVYAKFGVTIGRTTYDQIKDGTEVPMDKLQPGDLIFFGTWADPHHVGMYIGNGNYIHAPHTGDVIKISALGRSDYLTARRVK